MAGKHGGTDSRLPRAELVAARTLRTTAAVAPLDHREPRRVLDDSHHHGTGSAARAARPLSLLPPPEYIVVCAEIAILPLAFGAVEIAIVFSILNAALLSWRIRVEERALLGRTPP